MKPISIRRAGAPVWHPVSVNEGMLSIKGGFNTRGEVATSIAYTEGENTYQFVEVDKFAPWFRHAVGGPKLEKGDMKAIDVAKLLRREFLHALRCSEEQSSTVADGENPAVADGKNGHDQKDHDPMDDVDDLDDAAPSATKRPKKKTPKVLPNRAQVLVVKVPTRPRCAGLPSADLTSVRLYMPTDADKKTIATCT